MNLKSSKKERKLGRSGFIIMIWTIFLETRFNSFLKDATEFSVTEVVYILILSKKKNDSSIKGVFRTL